MATDHLTIAGAAGLFAIISGLGWASSQEHAVPPQLAPGLVSLSTAPCPPLARPRMVHTRLEPTNLLPDVVSRAV